MSRVREIAKSIEKEGVINPIEVDRNYIIITGEMRWRASVEAGLRTVPCKVIEKISDDDRFVRQVIENIHHNTMTPLDTADALMRIVSITGLKKDAAVRRISEMTGKKSSFINEYLDLLDLSDDVRKSIKDGAKYSCFRYTKRVPEKYSKSLEKKVTSGEIKLRDGIRMLAGAINANPDSADKLASYNYSKCRIVDDFRSAINKICGGSDTPLSDSLASKNRNIDNLSRLSGGLIDWMKSNSMTDMSKYEMKNSIKTLVGLKRIIEKYTNLIE